MTRDMTSDHKVKAHKYPVTTVSARGERVWVNSEARSLTTTTNDDDETKEKAGNELISL